MRTLARFVALAASTGDKRVIEDTAAPSFSTDDQPGEEALRQAAARFRAFVNASSDVVYRMSPDWSEIWQLDGRGFVIDTAEPRRDWLRDYIDPRDERLVTAAIEEAIVTRGSNLAGSKTYACWLPLLYREPPASAWRRQFPSSLHAIMRHRALAPFQSRGWREPDASILDTLNPQNYL